MYCEEVKQLVRFLYSKLIAESKKGRKTLARSERETVQRTCYLTGISRSTIMKWIKEDRPTTSKETNPHKKTFKKLDSFDIDVILRKIKEMMESGEIITTKKLQLVYAWTISWKFPRPHFGEL